MAHILHIEDSNTIAECVRRTLVEDGHRVAHAENFSEFIAHFHHKQPDLILLDLQTPGGSGVSIGQFVREHEHRAIPIVIFSAQPLEEIMSAVKQLGAAGFMHKSSPVKVLRNMVNRALAKSLLEEMLSPRV